MFCSHVNVLLFTSIWCGPPPPTDPHMWSGWCHCGINRTTSKWTDVCTQCYKFPTVVEWSLIPICFAVWHLVSIKYSWESYAKLQRYYMSCLGFRFLILYHHVGPVEKMFLIATGGSIFQRQKYAGPENSYGNWSEQIINWSPTLKNWSYRTFVEGRAGM
jgi:hypothetical protein